MSLFGFDHRQHEGSYAPYQTDMWTGYVGEVPDARGHTGTVDTVHIREQAQAPRDLIEDGAEGGGSMEDGAGQVPSTCDQHLHEAWGIDGFDHAYDTGADRGCDALDPGVGHCHGADMGLGMGHGPADMNRQTVIVSMVIIAVILISNLGAIWLLSL